MKNLVLLLWVMIGSFIIIDCEVYEWRYQPWYRKDFYERWAKESESKEPSEDEKSNENESKDDNSNERVMEFSSDQIEEHPDIWPCLYKGCRGKEQSPINIDTEAITTDEELGPLKFKNYDAPLSDLVIKNVGYTIISLVPTSDEVSVTSEWLGNKYRLFGIGFSYANSDKNGSLHTIDSKSYPLEVTLLHLNEKYKKYENQPDALLFLNILFEIGRENAAIKNITKSLRDIKEIDSNTTLKSSIIIKDLLPKFPENYVTYNGSIILPPCTEGVKFIIFHYINTISKAQLEKFRNLETEKNGRDLLEEVRPIQPLNYRKILSTRSQKEKVWWYQQPSQQYWK